MTNNGGKHTLIFSSEQTAYWHYNPITPASLMLIYRLEPDRSVCSTFILYRRVSAVFLTWSHLSREYEMGNIKKNRSFLVLCFYLHASANVLCLSSTCVLITLSSLNLILFFFFILMPVWNCPFLQQVYSYNFKRCPNPLWKWASYNLNKG